MNISKIFLFIIAVCTLAFTSCQELEGTDKSTSGSTSTSTDDQDRDNDVITGDDYVYHLPVIFHVLYNTNDQYIQYARLKEILSNVNELYQGNVYNLQIDTTESENIHVVFEMAKKDESGKTLSTPGVEYIKIDEKEISCDSFMSEEKYAKYTWDQNEYINVMVYAFKANDDQTTTLGISHRPFSSNNLPAIKGLTEINYYPLSKPTNFAYCVSINSLYLDQKYEGTRYTTDKNSKKYTYNSIDPNATLAHELGHYIGLYHVFAEDKEDGSMLKSDNDTDYCDDTPSYNRPAYQEWLTHYYITHRATGKGNLKEATVHSNSKGQTWKADNIMDYECSYSMRFTKDQAYRIRQVLYYSPLMPGPKKPRTKSRAWSESMEGELRLPINIAKEPSIKTTNITTRSRQ